MTAADVAWSVLLAGLVFSLWVLCDLVGDLIATLKYEQGDKPWEDSVT